MFKRSIRQSVFSSELDLCVFLQAINQLLAQERTRCANAAFCIAVKQRRVPDVVTKVVGQQSAVQAADVPYALLPMD